MVDLSPDDTAKVDTAYENIALSIASYEDSPEVNAFTSKYDQMTLRSEAEHCGGRAPATSFVPFVFRVRVGIPSQSLPYAPLPARNRVPKAGMMCRKFPSGGLPLSDIGRYG
jgi:hypothetical protein